MKVSALYIAFGHHLASITVYLFAVLIHGDHLVYTVGAQGLEPRTSSLLAMKDRIELSISSDRRK